MAETGSEKNRFEKLNGANFQSWSFNVEWLLKKKGLWEYVTGELQQPVLAADSSNLTAVNDYKCKQRQAQGEIVLSIDSNQQQHIYDSKTPQEAWDQLKAVFAPNSRPRVIQLIKMLSNNRFIEENEKMNDYTTRTRAIARQLEEVKCIFTDVQLTSFLLSGLPKSYDSMASSISNWSDAQYTFENVKAALQTESQRRNDNVEPTAEPSALATHSGTKSKQRAVFGGKPGKKKQTTDTRKCFKCQQTGHIARNCSSKQKVEQSKQGNDNVLHINSFLVTCFNAEHPKETSFVLDSGCTRHICNNKDWFVDFKEIDVIKIMSAENDKSSKLIAEGTGRIPMKLLTNRGTVGGILENVLYVPNCRRNLISVSQIEKQNKFLTIKDGTASIKRIDNSQVCARAKLTDGLYVLDGFPSSSQETAMVAACSEEMKWHRRFGHVSNAILQETSRRTKFKIPKLINNCTACVAGKMTKVTSPALTTPRAEKRMQLLHADVCGPMDVQSTGGSNYFMVVVDDYSRRIFVACMKTKGEATGRLRQLIKRFERLGEEEVVTLRTDNGLEFCNAEMTKFCNELGITHQRSNVESPEMNGVAERANRTLMDLVRAMLKDSKLPKQFWAEAITTAAYVRNKVYNRSIKDIPDSRWTGLKTTTKHLKAFGCLAYVRTVNQGRKKLDDRSETGIMIGYAMHTKGYRLWIPSKSGGVGKVIESKHVAFVEDYMAYEQLYDIDKRQKPPVDWVEVESDNEQSQVDTADEVMRNEPECAQEDEVQTNRKPGRPKGSKTSKVLLDGEKREQPKRAAKESSWKNPYWALHVDPVNVTEAMSSPNKSDWKKAMDDEYKSLLDRDTWEVVPKPENAPTISCKWIFKRKLGTNGNVERYKARLVARGFSQRAGVDYKDTYAPVASLSIIRMFLAIALHFGWYTRHIDVKCAYLYGKLDEDMFMELPEGYEHVPNTVGRLKRPIYGLKQAGRNWNEALTEFLKKNGFKRLWSSSCIYKRKGIIMIVYVDDVLLFSQEEHHITDVVSLLKKEYDIHDLGEPNHVLGIRIKRTNDKIMMDQESLIDEIIQKFQLDSGRKANTPLNASIPIAPLQEGDTPFDGPYQQAIGSLLYLALGTRPDISYAVNLMSQFNAKPAMAHWKQVCQIIRYLKTTKERKLTFNKSDRRDVTICSDSDWAADKELRRSWSGMITFICGSPVNWTVKKQKGVASSSMKAEYIALSTATKEGKWLAQLFMELGINNFEKPIQVKCDNQAAISFSRNRVENNRTKHIGIAYHLTREAIEDGIIEVSKIKTEDNPADVFTKALMKGKQESASKLVKLMLSEKLQSRKGEC